MKPTPPVPPSSPYTTCFSGNARENRERLHNIFTGGRKRSGKWLFPLSVLVMLLCCFCLVSCQLVPAMTEQEEDEAVLSAAPSPSAPVPAQGLAVDLNHNGIPEEIRPETSSIPEWLTFWEDGQLIARADPGDYLCTLDGRDYLLSCYSEVSGGSCSYSYTLNDPTDESDGNHQYGQVRFDLAFHAPFHQGYDPEAIAAYAEDLNALLAHSVQLSLADEKVVTRQAQPETLGWLDAFPDVFVRDPEKTLAETLEDYRQAMAKAYPAVSPQAQVDTLPLTEPLEMVYASGAGAWGSWLVLNPDGTFTGDYSDTDMDIRYVCQFHGSFTNIRPLTDASWLLTLGELTLDTPYPLGSEWNQEGMRMISSQPHGFDDQEGKALQPGAQFILYTPQARGHAPWTELYGASDFLSWWPNRCAFVYAQHTLGCYGLYNLEAGIGYFSQVS